MTFTLSFGWWIAPCVLTVLLLGGWRVFGVRMQRNNGDSFLDEYVKDTAEFHVFKKAGRVKKDRILRMGIRRGVQTEADGTK